MVIEIGENLLEVLKGIGVLVLVGAYRISCTE